HVRDVLNGMEEAKNPTNIIILDACRSNLTRGFRSSQALGLAEVKAAPGSLIAYATAPGATAEDNYDGRNGVYTAFLLKYMATPGLSVAQMFIQVCIGVRQATQGEQTPWELSSLTSDFSFAPSDTSSTPTDRKSVV